MIKIKNIVLILILALFVGCKNKAPAKNKITVAVAASSQFAFRALAKAFEAVHGVEVNIIVGSSGKLTTQIIHGAPYDIFISADMGYPEILVAKKKTIGKVFLYAGGIPVFWTLNDAIDLENINTHLISSEVKKIAIADPRNAPYGEMAVAYLNTFNLYEKVKTKLVFGESISQVNEYVLNKTVSLGISAKSVVTAKKLKNIGTFKDFGEDYFIKQGMVVIKNDTPTKPKTDFVDFVLSEKGKNILKKFGYIAL